MTEQPLEKKPSERSVVVLDFSFATFRERVEQSLEVGLRHGINAGHATMLFGLRGVTGRGRSTAARYALRRPTTG
jgi:hypothetical protein